VNALRRTFAIAWLEIALLLRSRTTFTLLILVPALQVLLFGYAIRPGAAVVTVAIAAPTPANADDIARRLRSEPGFVVTVTRLKPGEAADVVRQGKALIGIEVPASRSFANPLQVQQPLRLVVDGTNAALTDAAVARIEAAYWREITRRSDMAESGPGIRVERLYNAQGRADWTFLPALIGVTVMIAMVMLGTLSVAREREAGTWEGLAALPISAAEILAGKLLPCMVIGTVQGVLVLTIGQLLFDLPARGSVVALVALLPVFAGAHYVLGYVVSVRARTQLAALQGAVAFYLPAMLLSGFLYPFDTLPNWARMIGNLFPLAHMIRAARAALLQGAGAEAVLAHGFPILAFLVVGIAIALIAPPPRLD
jgi:ABC-2 type transport system permease protein